VKEKGGKKRGRHDNVVAHADVSNGSQDPNVNPVLAGILYRSTSETNISSATSAGIQQTRRGGNLATQTHSEQTTQQALARVAVGKGIKHRFSVQRTNSAKITLNNGSNSSRVPEDNTTPLQAGLSALNDNFKNSLSGQIGDQSSMKDTADFQAPEVQVAQVPAPAPPFYVPGSLRRDDSLIDLAMLPIVDDSDVITETGTSTGMTFVDFPWQDPSLFPEDETNM
jgi:hypothetical protein